MSAVVTYVWTFFTPRNNTNYTLIFTRITQIDMKWVLAILGLRDFIEFLFNIKISFALSQ